MSNIYKNFKYTVLLFLISIKLLGYDKSEIEYLIICSNESCEYAEEISNLYNYDIESENKLLTTYININAIQNINDSLNYNIRKYISEFTNLKFLLLFGTYENIPPIEKNSIPSDDYYTTTSENFNLYESTTLINTGRIPFDDDYKSKLYVEKLKKYLLEKNPGSWKSKILLVSDDQYKNGNYNKIEYSHTENSDMIFNILNPFFNIYQLYGINYNTLFNGVSYTHSNLNNDLINHINNGNLLINYIGHGNSSSWSEEKILDKSRDISRISPKNEAIWVAGTCGFGRYFDDQNIVKDLLVNNGGAIAVISTVDDISYTDNKIYLENFFNIFKKNSTINQYRLSEVFNLAKSYYCIDNSQTESNCSGIWSNDGYCRTNNFDSCFNSSNWLSNESSEKLFHYFGDPALKIPSAKLSQGLIEYETNALVVEENNIYIKTDLDSIFSYIEITSNDYSKINYTQNDSLIYTKRGDHYFNSYFNNQNICYRIPIDSSECDSCKLYINYFQEDRNGNLLFQKETDITIDSNINQYNDLEGPKISLYQNNFIIQDGASIKNEIPIRIILNDPLGINISETNNHMIKYWVNDNSKNSVSGSLFSYSDDCQEGDFEITLPIDDINENLTFNVEARDNFNNISKISMNLNNIFSNNDSLFYKLYNFPNPFYEDTYITLLLNENPVDVFVNIYTIRGKHILSEKINNYNDEYFYYKWDSKDMHGNIVPSGVYVYSITANSTNSKKTMTQFSKAIKILKNEN